MMGFDTLLVFSACISLFCCGLHLITSDGYILDFLYKPYAWLSDNQEKLTQRYKAGFEKSPWKRIFITASCYILTPIIGCYVCFGSFWTFVWVWVIYGMKSEYIPMVILIAFIVSFLNALVMAIYEKLQ